MALDVQFDPYNPIPNNPFYSAPSNYLQGPSGPLVIGAGLNVSATGILTSTGSGSGGTVTSITAGAGLTGGTISSTGTIALAPSGAVVGSYTYASITVDTYGRVTSALSGTPVVSVTVNSPLLLSGSSTAPIISVQQASTALSGVTRLNNTTSSTLTNQALTAAAGKSLQDQINSLAQNANGLILSGTLDTATGLVVTATTAGILGGITAGSPLPSPTPALNDYYLIVTVPNAGTYTPPGSPAITGIVVGDYIICVGGVWTILRVGPITGAYATTTTAGVVELATPAEVIAGTDPNLVVTPFGGASAYVNRNAFTAKGQVLSGTGSSTFSALPLGTDGFVLTVDSSCASGLKWAPGGGGSGGITSLQFNSPLTSSPNPVTAGVAAVDITYASTSTCGAVQLADTAATQAGVSATLAVTAAGAAATYFPICDYTALGQLAVGTGANTFNILPVGANGTGLVACSSCPAGVYWGSALIPAQPTVLGAVYGLGEPGLGQNFSVGCGTLGLLTTGQGNTAIGLGGLAQVSSGCYNTALGTQALFAEQTGCFNTGVGTGALCAQNGSSQNTALGYGAGNSITTGLANTLVGAVVGDNLSSGGCNVLVGVNAGLALTIANNNTIVGANAGCNSTGNTNVFIGCGSALNATTQSNQIVLGAGNSCTLGTANGGVTFAFGASCFLYASAGSAVWTSASDARLKEEVADLALGLDFVNQLQPRTYQWKESKEKAAGFVAQELQEIVVEHDASYLGLVDTENEYMGVAPAALVPVLVKAIQELSAEVAELKAKLG